MKRIFSLIVMIVFGLISIPEVSEADIYMKRQRQTDAVQIMGVNQPAENVIEEIWITKKGFRSDDPKNSIIMITQGHKAIMIDHTAKTYMERNLNLDEMQKEMGKDQDPQEAAAMKGMMQNMMKIEAIVQPTGETKKIKKWNCKKYILTMNTFMGQIQNEVWATEDLKIDQNLYDKFVTSMMSAMPGMESAMKEAIEEMKKIKGVQVKNISTQNIMNQTRKTVTELMEYKDGKAPKNLLTPPKGYTKKAL